MKRWLLMFVTVFIAFGAYGHSEESGPLKLVQTIKLPADVKGHFDHFEIDLKNHRLFATPESYKAVLVFDLLASLPTPYAESTSRTQCFIAKI